MKNVLVVCTALAALLCMSVSAARWIGFQRPAESYSGFERCALPCFAGIIPGMTSVQEARRALEQLTGSHGSEEALSSGKWVYSTPTLQILLSTDFNRAIRLDLDSIQQPALLTLGDTILMLGAPSMIYALPLNTLDQYEVFLNYSSANYGVYFLFRTGSRLEPQTRADAVKIYALTEKALSIPLFPVERGHRWSGFGALWTDAPP